MERMDHATEGTERRAHAGDGAGARRRRLGAGATRAGLAAPWLLAAGLAAADPAGPSAPGTMGAAGDDVAKLSERLSNGAAAAPTALAALAAGPFRLDGTVEAFWRTSEGASPLSRGTFRLERDADGGLRLRAEMPVLGPIEYGSAGGTAWEIDPVFGARRLEGESSRTLRRVLAAVLGGRSIEDLYDAVERVESVESEGDAFRLEPSADPGDRYEIDAAGILREAAVSHRNAAGETQRLEIAHGEPGEDLPGDVTIDREHYRFVLRPAKIDRGAQAVGSVRAPEDVPDEFGDEPRDLHEPVLRNVSEIPVASIRARVSLREISKELAEMLPETMRVVGEQGIPPIGPPFTRYFTMETGGEIDIEAGFPVARPIQASGRVKPRTLPAGRVASVWHIGPYHTVGETHSRLMAWSAKRGLAPAGGPWEIYWTDPGLEPDSSRWRTEIVLPVRSTR